MASNRVNYKDTTPAKKLDKRTMNRMVWRSLNLQASFNYERMQAAGWLWGILPGLEKIHTDKDDLSASMEHNLEFFNTHPFLVTFVMGIVLSLEQQKADINTIRAVRVAAMGPLGGIGDAIFWFSLIPITAGITAGMAIDQNLAGPILFFVITFGVQMALRFWLLNWSYSLGEKAVVTLTKNAKEFTRAASILGVFVVGALTCNYGATKLGVIIPNGDKPINIQGLLDGILPALVPLALTLMCFFLIKKKSWKPTKIIGLLLVIGIVGSMFGIWEGSAGMIVDTDNDGVYDAEMAQGYEALVPVPWHNNMSDDIIGAAPAEE
ncbi:MAG: PTS system mannose/fructose/sorbose family transporter subunit IID [Erysipelotrichaceae bacterium]